MSIRIEGNIIATGNKQEVNQAVKSLTAPDLSIKDNIINFDYSDGCAFGHFGELTKLVKEISLKFKNVHFEVIVAFEYGEAFESISIQKGKAKANESFIEVIQEEDSNFNWSTGGIDTFINHITNIYLESEGK